MATNPDTRKATKKVPTTKLPRVLKTTVLSA
jgi:hypothetical protein